MNLNVEETASVVGFWKTEDFTWLFETGMKIYCEIFRINPSLKSLFPYIVQCEKDGKDIKELNQFRFQALRFVQVLSLAVSNIAGNDPKINDLDDRLFRLGQLHQRLVEIHGFKPEYWDVFKNATVQVIEMECKKQTDFNLKTSIDAWRKVCDYIVDGMVRGFQSHSNNSIPPIKCNDFVPKSRKASLDFTPTARKCSSSTCAIT